MARSNILVRASKQQGIALSIARNKLESVRAAGYAAVPASGSFSDSLLSSLPVNATATSSSSDYNAKTKLFTVTVTWRDPGFSGSSTVTLSTLITQTGGLP